MSKKINNNLTDTKIPLHTARLWLWFLDLCFQLGHVALFFTYSAMEEEIERNKEHPQFAPLYFPHELHRRDALARDLEFFYGEDWRSQIRISPAAQRYVERIRRVGRDQPALLVAHAYTRYMGDLSGGQVLRKVAQRAMKLPPTGEGLNFYEFDGIHSAKAFKQLYRSRMNELELDTHTKRSVVEEANLAFRFNMEVSSADRLELQFKGLVFSCYYFMQDLLNQLLSFFMTFVLKKEEFT